MKNISFIFVFITIIMSCNNNSKLSKDILMLQKKPIILTKQSELITYGIDSETVNGIQCDLKYIIYRDSLDCTSCAINKMYLWDELIEYAKSYNGRLKYYFIYSPSKKASKSVELVLRNSNFKYPIILDTLGEFAKLNPHLPNSKILHTFLLDENNNVILVGDPLYNKKIKEMFHKIVEEKLGKPEKISIKDSAAILSKEN